MNTPKAPAIWLSEQAVRDLVVSARKAKASLVALVAGIDAKVEARRDVINKSLGDMDVKDRLGATTVAARHVGLGPGFVDEDQPFRVEIGRRTRPAGVSYRIRMIRSGGGFPATSGKWCLRR